MIIEPCFSSGELSAATNVVLATPGLIWGVALHPAAADCSIKIYDNAATATAPLVYEILAYTLLADGSQVITFPSPIYCSKGIVAVVAGSGAKAHVLYTKSY